MKKDSIPYIVLFTFAACIVYILPLAVANELTKPRVEANRLFAAHSAVLRAFGIPYADAADAEAQYGSVVRELEPVEGMDAAWSATIDGADYLAVRQAGAGLWGTITAIVAADAAGTRLRGIEILDQVETPGLGGRIDEAWFKEQFRGKKIGPDGRITVDQNGSGKGEADKESPRVDAISGASRTSDFIQDIVNGAIAALGKRGGGK